MNYPQKKYNNWLLDILFPVRCINCHEYGNYLCKRCLGQIVVNKNFQCIGCKRLVSLGQTCILCRKSNSVDRLLIVTDYKNPVVEKILKFFKYQFIEELKIPIFFVTKKYFKWLGHKKIDIFKNNPILVPIPLSRRRLNWRGFNQAEIVTRNLAGYFNMQARTDILVRIRNSIPQADINSKEERVKNAQKLFLCNSDNVSGREAILIDDICTTGATLNECAKALKEKGVLRVTALVIARG